MGKIKMKITIKENDNILVNELKGIKNEDYIIFKDDYKTVIDLKKYKITRIKDNYKLELNLILNKKTLSKLHINNKILNLDTYTNYIKLENNLFEVSYLIENNPINIKIEM